MRAYWVTSADVEPPNRLANFRVDYYPSDVEFLEYARRLVAGDTPVSPEGVVAGPVEGVKEADGG